MLPTYGLASLLLFGGVMLRKAGRFLGALLGFVVACALAIGILGVVVAWVFWNVGTWHVPKMADIPEDECPEYRTVEVDYSLRSLGILETLWDRWRGRSDANFETVSILFSTDREISEYLPNRKICMLKTADGEFVRRTFGRGRGAQLHFGKALVSVPTATHVVGGIERPGYQLLGLTWYREDEDPARHFTLRWITVDAKEVFSGHVRQTAEGAKRFKRKVLVYVHGYNMSFDSALFRAAQLSYDIGFDGPVIAYSWPASGNLEDYLYDQNSALRTVASMEAFLEVVAAVPTIDHVEIIAHSLGSLPTVMAIKKLHEKHADLSKFKRVVLAAPDIDKDVFAELSREIREQPAQRLTIYASANDRALQVSARLAGAVERVGGIYRDAPLVFTNVDTVDVSSAKTDYFGLNHSAYAESFLLLNDIAVLLRDGTRPPGVRTPLLKERNTQQGPYWKYPN